MGKGGGLIWFLVSVTPPLPPPQMLEIKSALKSHKTQAQCVVSSPTATPSYRLEKKTVDTKKSVCFCLTHQSQDCSSCGVYMEMSITAQ